MELHQIIHPIHTDKNQFTVILAAFIAKPNGSAYL